MRTSPSPASNARASLMGLRLTRSSAARTSSLRRWPGFISPSTIRRLSSFATLAAVEKRSRLGRATSSTMDCRLSTIRPNPSQQARGSVVAEVERGFHVEQTSANAADQALKSERVADEQPGLDDVIRKIEDDRLALARATDEMTTRTLATGQPIVCTLPTRRIAVIRACIVGDEYRVVAPIEPAPPRASHVRAHDVKRTVRDRLV